jgi:hypothetical protein
VSKMRLHEAATMEAEAAVRWYNERLVGLGHGFRAELIRAVDQHRSLPAPAATERLRPKARRFLLPRFP